MTDRKQLQDAYINEVIDGMDLKDMCALLFDLMDKDMDSYTDEELKAEVEEYYPHLLQDWREIVPVEALSTISPKAPQWVPYYVHQGEGDRPHTH